MRITLGKTYLKLINAGSLHFSANMYFTFRRKLCVHNYVNINQRKENDFTKYHYENNKL